MIENPKYCWVPAHPEWKAKAKLLTLVKLDSDNTLFCYLLDRETPFAIVATTGEIPGSDFLGLYTPDGGRISDGRALWGWSYAEEAPADVLEAIEATWLPWGWKRKS